MLTLNQQLFECDVFYVMIDSNIKCNGLLGFQLQSWHVIKYSGHLQPKLFSMGVDS